MGPSRQETRKAALLGPLRKGARRTLFVIGVVRMCAKHKQNTKPATVARLSKLASVLGLLRRAIKKLLLYQARDDAMKNLHAA